MIRKHKLIKLFSVLSAVVLCGCDLGIESSDDIQVKTQSEQTSSNGETENTQEQSEDPTEHFSVSDIKKSRLSCYMLLYRAESENYVFYYPLRTDLVAGDETQEGSMHVYDMDAESDSVLYTMDEGEKPLLLAASKDQLAAISFVYSENNGNTYWLRKNSPDGTDKKTNITEDLTDGISIANANMGLDGDGNVYLCTTDQQMLVWNSDGELSGTYPLDHVLTAVSSCDGEGIYLFSTDSAGVCIQKASPSGVTSVADSLEIAELAGASVSELDGSCLLYNSKNLYEVDLSSGEIVQTTSANELYLSNFTNISCTAVDGQWSVNTYLDNLSVPYTVTSRILKKELSAQKQVLTLGGVSLTDSVLEKVALFNGNHSDYEIKVVENYTVTDDYSVLLDEFEQSLIDQETYDIYYLPYEMQAYDLVSTGIFADMAEFIENDEELSMDDFCSGLLNTCTYRGILYAIPESFVLISSVGYADVWDGVDSPSLDNISALMESNSGLYLDNNSTTPNKLLIKLMMGGNRSVMSDSGLSVSKDDIKSMLEFAKKYGSVPESNGSLFDSGDSLMLNYVEIMGYELESAWWATDGNGKYVICGYPAFDGNGSYFQTASLWAVSSQCSNPELAWEFVREFFMEDYQLENCGEYFPVNVHSLEKLIDGLEADEYYKQEFYRCLDGAKYLLEYDSQAYEIIAEEAEAYFSGNKTADDVAQAAYERLLLYAAENN